MFRCLSILRGGTGPLVMLLVLSGVSPALPQTPAQKPKDPLWTHAFDVQCRKYGEANFTPNTQKFAFEVFKDTNTGYGIYISQVGAIAVAPGFADLQKPIRDSKAPTWIGGLDLPSRKAGQQEFTSTTRVYSLERFRDPNVSTWLYVTEHGLVAVTPAKGTDPATNALKPPKWQHSIDLGARRAGNPSWKDAHKFGIEVYRDQDTASLIYICDTGAIAVVPDSGAATPPDKGKNPVWLHGLELYCRKNNERDFSAKTRKFALEVFRDENNGNLIYLCETGSLAVLPELTKLAAPTPKVTDPKFSHGLNLSCRTVGEKEFTDKTRVYGAEVFQDENTGVTLYLAETGSISAVPTR